MAGYGVEQIDSFAAHRSRSNTRKRLQHCGQKAFFVVGQVMYNHEPKPRISLISSRAALAATSFG